MSKSKLVKSSLDKLIGDKKQAEQYLAKGKRTTGKNLTSKEAAKARAKVAKIKEAIRKEKAKDKPKKTVTKSKPNRMFSKKFDIVEGARLDPETGTSVSAARSVARGEAGKVTKGKKSVDKGMAESVSKGEKSRAKKVTDLEREINKLEDKKKLGAAEASKLKTKKAQLKKLDKKSATGETSRRRKAAVRSSSTKRKDKGITLAGPEGTKITVGKKYKDSDMMFGNTTNGITKTGEKVGNPTIRQIESAIEDLDARASTPRIRKLQAELEELFRKEGYKKFKTQSAVGPRKGKNLSFRARAEDKQTKSMLEGKLGNVTGKNSSKKKRRHPSSEAPVKKTMGKNKTQKEKLKRETKRKPTTSTVGKNVKKMMDAIRKRGSLKQKPSKPRTTFKDGTPRARKKKKDKR